RTCAGAACGRFHRGLTRDSRGARTWAEEMLAKEETAVGKTRLMVAPSNASAYAIRPLSIPIRSAGLPGTVPLDLSKIMVPLDGSPLAEAALATALDLARGSAGSLLLLRAAELELDDSVGAQIRRLREAESYLASLERRLRRTSSVDIMTT